MKNENQVSAFWKAYNSSRCKTAMLIISIIITLAFAITEITNISNEDLKVAMIGLIGYWSGRSSKSKDKSNSDNWQ